MDNESTRTNKEKTLITQSVKEVGQITGIVPFARSDAFYKS